MIETHPKLYTDGGVVRKNPSKIAGTCAYVLVEKDKEVRHGAASLFSFDFSLPNVSNNVTELAGVLLGLRTLPDDWRGEILTDSGVTQARLVNERPKVAGVPKCMVDELWMHRKRLGPLWVTLLSGHPTLAHLRAGIGKKGRPVSEWNVKCDRLCKNLAEKLFEQYSLSVSGAGEYVGVYTSPDSIHVSAVSSIRLRRWMEPEKEGHLFLPYGVNYERERC